MRRHAKHFLMYTLPLAATIAAYCAAPLQAFGQERPSTDSTSLGAAPLKDELTPQIRTAVTRGLSWLAKNQQPEGTFTGGGDNIGISALAGIAMLSDGSLPGEGPYGPACDKTLGYILKNCQESGLVASQNYGSPMYGHGFASLFLAEAYGQTSRPDVKEKLQNAIRLLVQTQNREGGWRYQPVPNDADISVTICQIMALRAARNAGIKVPKLTIDRAIDYVKKSQEPDGGFSYMLNSRGSAFPRSAAGVACLFYAGIYDGEEIKKGVKYLMNNLPGKPGGSAEYHYYYGNYYAVQAMFLAGGDAWAAYWPAICKELLAKQQADGSWQGEAGTAYATSMACIILQVPNRLLPILQK